MYYSFIVNPKAGKASPRRVRALERALERSHLPYRILESEGPGHAIELSLAASHNSDVVVAVGGDGTVHEVVSGLVASDSDAQLGIIPWGSGNDFAKMFDIPRGAGKMVECLRTCKPSLADLGRVEWNGPGGRGAAVFVNVAGTGIDAGIAAAASKITYLTGTLRYLAAVLQTLRHWRAPSVDVEISGAGDAFRSMTSEVLLVVAANGRCAAGGFYLTPQASITDGALDACIIENASVLRILALIPGVLRGGRHVGEPEVTVAKGRKIEVRSSEPQAVQADGEVLTLAATRVTFEVEPDGLCVRMPVKT